MSVFVPLEILLQSSSDLENQVVLTAATGKPHRAGMFPAIPLYRIAKFRQPISNFQTNCEQI